MSLPLALLLFATPSLLATEPPLLQAPGVREALGAPLSPELTVQDETGRSVPLGSFFGRAPLLLTLVYYRCPSVCTLLLNGVAESLMGLEDARIGEDYLWLTLSFDPHDTPERAQRKKENYLRTYPLPGAPAEAWHFLTATEPVIAAILKESGYLIVKEGEEFVHPAVLLLLTQKGRIQRYLYGTSFSPRELRLALLEAGMTPKTLLDRLSPFLYAYDPALRSYRIRPLLPALGFAGILLFLLFLFWQGQRLLNPKVPEGVQEGTRGGGTPEQG